MEISRYGDVLEIGGSGGYTDGKGFGVGAGL
jgi:hypothetical protein